jgi:hypothetical protein
MWVVVVVREDFSPQHPILSLRVHTTSTLGWEARVELRRRQPRTEVKEEAQPSVLLLLPWVVVVESLTA